MDAGRDLRAEIIDAAWSILRSTGFEGIKVQRVVAEAGTSTRAFYQEFEDKDALFVALMQDEYARSAVRLARVVASWSEPAEQVAAWVSELISAAGDPHRAPRARLFSSQPALMHRFPETFESADALLRGPLITALRHGHELGVFSSGHPEGDAELIAQLAGASMSHALGGTDCDELERTIARVAHFVLRALGCPLGWPVPSAESADGLGQAGGEAV